MRVYKIIATGLGTGYAPKAPGTVGSMIGLTGFILLNSAILPSIYNPIIIGCLNLLAILVLSIIGNNAINKGYSEKAWKHDASCIVVDEIIGIWISLLFLPFSWEYWLAGFALFRFFDIAKPLFIKRIDSKHSSWSVILDDVIAGIYANVVLQLAHFVL